MKTLTVKGADMLAAKFRSDWGFSLAEPINVKTMIRRLDVMLIYRPLSDNSYGISCMSGKKRFMLVNSNSTRGRQHFTIAHELYHLYYDENPSPHMCCNIAEGEEKNANRFASSLLMPREGVFAMASPDEVRSYGVSLATVLKMEQYFGVSRGTMLFRLKDIGIVSQRSYEEMKTVGVKESARAYGYDLSLYEPGNEGLVIGDFGTKARRLFESGRISEGHYNELMNMIQYEGGEKS